MPGYSTTSLSLPIMTGPKHHSPIKYTKKRRCQGFSLGFCTEALSDVNCCKTNLQQRCRRVISQAVQSRSRDQRQSRDSALFLTFSPCLSYYHLHAKDLQGCRCRPPSPHYPAGQLPLKCFRDGCGSCSLPRLAQNL